MSYPSVDLLNQTEIERLERGEWSRFEPYRSPSPKHTERVQLPGTLRITAMLFLVSAMVGFWASSLVSAINFEWVIYWGEMHWVSGKAYPLLRALQALCYSFGAAAFAFASMWVATSAFTKLRGRLIETVPLNAKENRSSDRSRPQPTQR